MYEKHSKHGDYGVFVGLDDSGKAVTLDGNSDAKGHCLIVVHDDSKDGLTADERAAIAIKAAMGTIYWNDAESYHWMFDFNVDGHWCEMWHGNDDEPYWLAQHIIVYS